MPEAVLRSVTQLNDAGVYETPLDRLTFINLYPFLPAHFEILLHLLGRLARKTGGLGLRSAIKVLQDVPDPRGRTASAGRRTDAMLAKKKTKICKIPLSDAIQELRDELRKAILEGRYHVSPASLIKAETDGCVIRLRQTH